MSALTASSASPVEITSDIEMSRCCICYATYNRTNRAPISMACGHTFCHGCIRHMTTKILFSCGVCRTVSPVGWTETKKNVVLIQALEKLNLLASDDSDETLDSSPLGSNPFLVDEVNNVDSKNMLHHGKQSLKVLSKYLESNYDDPYGAFQSIYETIDLLEGMQQEAAEVEASQCPTSNNEPNPDQRLEEEVPTWNFREWDQQGDGLDDFTTFVLNINNVPPLRQPHDADRAILERRIAATLARLVQISRSLHNAGSRNNVDIYHVNHGRHGINDSRGYRRIVDNGRVRIGEVDPLPISNANHRRDVTRFHDNLGTVNRNDEASDSNETTRNDVNDATNTNLRAEHMLSNLDDILDRVSYILLTIR
uniref:RING-type domain-containing protein n=1 Tax=Panagrellus redivivus TaxID=6233 RepID=A0A7E4ZR21_PANRE